MTPKEIEKFNFLEAAARVWLSHNNKKLEPCILPRHRKPRLYLDTTAYLVRFKRGEHYVAAHVSDNMIIFKYLRGVKNITRVYFTRIVSYLEERDKHSPPGILLDR